MKVIFAKQMLVKDQLLQDHGLVISNGLIEAIVPRSELDGADFELLNSEAAYLLPGFIDVHIHGSAGFDVMDASEDALKAIQASLVKTGTTSFLGTTMTLGLENILLALTVLRRRMDSSEVDGARILGAHLEGPFINPKAKGAHLEAHIIAPQLKLLENYKDVIRLITLAPETDPEQAFIKGAKALGIRVSLGHSTCSYDCAKAAIHEGADSVTHLFNAMSGLHHRDPGLVGAALLSDVYTELIADNVHVHPDLYELVYKLKGPDRMLLITDAMKGQCMKQGRYDLGGQTVLVGETDARLEDGTLAGSILTQDKGLRHMLKTKGLDIVKVSRMLSANPAALLGLTDIGQIKVGAKADLALLNESFEVIGTTVSGKLF